MCQGINQPKFQRHKYLKYKLYLFNPVNFARNVKIKKSILPSKVHKIFALHPLNQSQLHKRYPPVEIKTCNDDEKWCFPKASAQAGHNYNHGNWYLWNLFLYIAQGIVI
jgi:hypothetical protein